MYEIILINNPIFMNHVLLFLVSVGPAWYLCRTSVL